MGEGSDAEDDDVVGVALRGVQLARGGAGEGGVANSNGGGD